MLRLVNQAFLDDGIKCRALFIRQHTALTASNQGFGCGASQNFGGEYALQNVLVVENMGVMASRAPAAVETADIVMDANKTGISLI